MPAGTPVARPVPRAGRRQSRGAWTARSLDTSITPATRRTSSPTRSFSSGVQTSPVISTTPSTTCTRMSRSRRKLSSSRRSIRRVSRSMSSAWDNAVVGEKGPLIIGGLGQSRAWRRAADGSEGGANRRRNPPTHHSRQHGRRPFTARPDYASSRPRQCVDQSPCCAPTWPWRRLKLRNQRSFLPGTRLAKCPCVERVVINRSAKPASTWLVPVMVVAGLTSTLGVTTSAREVASEGEAAFFNK